MIRMHVDEKFRPALEASGFDSYTTFMGHLAGELIEADHRRDIWRVQLDDYTCYLKRVTMEGIAAALESYCQARLAHSKPWAEMLHIMYLQAAGVAVALVLAA